MLAATSFPASNIDIFSREIQEPYPTISNNRQKQLPLAIYLLPPLPSTDPGHTSTHRCSPLGTCPGCWRRTGRQSTGSRPAHTFPTEVISKASPFLHSQVEVICYWVGLRRVYVPRMPETGTPSTADSETKRVILSDSTLYGVWDQPSLPSITDHMDIECIVGGRVRHLTRVLEMNLLYNKNRLEIIVMCGINNIGMGRRQTPLLKSMNSSRGWWQSTASRTSTAPPALSPSPP